MAEQPSKIAICELADLRSDLDIAVGDSSFDDRLRRTISGVSRAIESFCGRPFLARDIAAEKFDGDGTEILLLGKVPIIKVSTLLNDTTTVASTAYVFYSALGKITLIDGTVFTLGPQKVSVTYRVGWERTELPEDVSMAARLWCVHIFKLIVEGRAGIELRSEAFQESASYTAKKMPDEVRELLEPYRLWR